MNESEFRAEVGRIVALYEKVIGQYAANTRAMIRNYGELGALSRLMVSADLQPGFKKLRDQNLLHETFEALIVRCPNLFNPEIVEAAQWRLDNADQLL